MSSSDATQTSAQGPVQAAATEATPLVKRITLTQVVFGQAADTETARATAASGDGDGEELRDGEFADVPSLEGQAGDLEVVAGSGSDAQRESIFKENVEQHILKTDPGFMRWLTSSNGVAMQGILCATLVIIQAESSVWNEIARKHIPYAGYKTFNSAALGVGVSIGSVVLCVAVAAMRDELSLLFNRGSMGKLLKYLVPGCGFQVTQWLNLMALGLLSADVAKVLDQGRLLMTALITLQVFGRNQSIAGWNSLVVVSLASVSYAAMNQLLVQVASYKKQTEQLRGMLADSSIRAPPAQGDAAGGYNDGYLLGLLIVAFSIVAQSGLCVLCEKVFKEDRGLSFYVQKFYLEVPGIFMGLFLTNVGNPLLYCFLRDELKAGPGILGKVGGEGELWEHFRAPFQGWNMIVVWAFVLLVVKSWLSGLLVKQLNAIVKQLCSVFGVGITYFVMKVHICRDGAGKATGYFCPSNLATAEFPMVVVDLCVLFAVLAYTLAGRDKQRKVMFKREAKEAKEANEAKASGDAAQSAV